MLKYIVSFFINRHSIFLTILLSLIFTNSSYSQTVPQTRKVLGKVVTIENDQIIPLRFATVRLLMLKDSALVSGTTTNEDGNLSLD